MTESEEEMDEELQLAIALSLQADDEPAQAEGAAVRRVSFVTEHGDTLRSVAAFLRYAKLDKPEDGYLTQLAAVGLVELEDVTGVKEDFLTRAGMQKEMHRRRFIRCAGRYVPTGRHGCHAHRRATQPAHRGPRGDVRLPAAADRRAHHAGAEGALHGGLAGVLHAGRCADTARAGGKRGGVGTSVRGRKSRRK